MALALLVSCETNDQKRAATVTPPPEAMAPAVPAPAAPAPAPPPRIAEQQAPRPDPVTQLIATVEAEFAAGQANYNAGHLEAAKQNFDRAFNLLVEAPLSIRDDERLDAEFEKIVDGVNALEMSALKMGDGFTEQKSEPAPIDEANDVTFPVDPRIKAQAEAQIRETHSDLPLVLNDTVASYINYFSSRGRGVLEHALARAGRYREMIEATLRQEGVPQDLIYLAQAESGFHPLALSRASARGMWQFMASRAAGYGLTRNWWLDERQDPEKATRAAARHLHDLYNQFGDWYLVMAAYNSGPGVVQAGVERTGYADFWELYRRGVLPKETKNYVPIILAITIMAKNPTQYGLDHVVPEPPRPADRITIDYPVDLRLAAECVDSSVAELQELNPALLRMTTPPQGSFDLNLPGGTRDKFLTNIASIPADKRTWWRYHNVSAGDTLAEVAHRYHTSPRAIAEVNNLHGNELIADSKLIIPIAAGGNDTGENSVHYSKAIVRYKVRQGDTVESVAGDWGISAAALRKWNHIKSNQLARGRLLVIHRPLDARDQESASPNNNKSLTHSSLRASSHPAAAPAHHSAQASAAPQHSRQPAAAANKTVHHTVRAGETLYAIANRYNTTVAALRRENGRTADHLRPGIVLTVAVDR
ncbi:MAG: LysM peptidoglycan-binding domain-containing protein [Acidobacteria bacterium]|nr:LysM peptidoglycan-binding domain-containing protein [Acidobacteriota bacterium]